MPDDWVCHRPNRSHSKLEFSLMASGLLNPTVPAEIVPPINLRQDEEGRVWQKGGFSLQDLYAVFKENPSEAVKCFTKRRHNMQNLRRIHCMVFELLSRPQLLIKSRENVVANIKDGMCLLYSSLVLGLLDDLAIDDTSLFLSKNSDFVTANVLITTLLKSACARAILQKRLPLAAAYEFDIRVASENGLSYLSPLDAEVPHIYMTKKVALSTVRTWPTNRAKEIILNTPWLATLLIMLYELGQENYYIGARFRTLAATALWEMTGRRDDYSSLEISDILQL